MIYIDIWCEWNILQLNHKILYSKSFQKEQLNEMLLWFMHASFNNASPQPPRCSSLQHCAACVFQQRHEWAQSLQLCLLVTQRRGLSGKVPFPQTSVLPAYLFLALRTISSQSASVFKSSSKTGDWMWDMNDVSYWLHMDEFSRCEKKFSILVIWKICFFFWVNLTSYFLYWPIKGNQSVGLQLKLLSLTGHMREVIGFFGQSQRSSGAISKQQLFYLTCHVVCYGSDLFWCMGGTRKGLDPTF